MLAMEYALTHPAGLASLVLASAPASVPQWVGETAKLRAQLPQDVQDTLRRHQDAETTADPEYQLAAMEFYRRHVCRVDPGRTASSARWPRWSTGSSTRP